MKVTYPLFATIVGVFLTFSAYAKSNAERYQEWMGEVTVDTTSPENPYTKTVCRADKDGFLVCFDIFDLSPAFGKGFDMLVSVTAPEGHEELRLSTEHWPDFVIDGHPLFDMNLVAKPEEYSGTLDPETAFWTIVTYKQGSGFDYDIYMPDTWKNYDAMMKGKTLTATIHLQDGTQRKITFPLGELKLLVHYFLPDCCREPR